MCFNTGDNVFTPEVLPVPPSGRLLAVCLYVSEYLGAYIYIYIYTHVYVLSLSLFPPVYLSEKREVLLRGVGTPW